MKTVRLYRLKAMFYDGFQWDIVIAATGMDWVTMWITNENGSLIEEMSIVDFSTLDFTVSEGFSMSKGINEKMYEFVERVEKIKGK